MKHYRHLTKRDRVRIARMKSYGYSFSKIARKTGFNKSTISRELRRNGEYVERDMRFFKKLYLDLGLMEDYLAIEAEADFEWFQSYETKRAEQRAKERRERSAKRIKISSEMKKWVKDKLSSGFTPEQVAGRSKIEYAPGISHESVYKIVIEDKKMGGRLYRKLPRFGKRKQRTSRRSYEREHIPNRVSIEERPKAALKRKRVGDLEGDLIVGRAHKSYLLTLVDRTTRQVAIEYLRRKDRTSVRDALLATLKRMPKARTLTLDNAKEFSCHEEVTKLTGVKIYFANPYASYERGTNENTNGIIRRTFPKRTDFRRIRREKIQALERKLNSTPRKILGYLTAEEVMNQKLGEGVALRS